MTYLLKYGSYTFPAGWKPISHSNSGDLGEQERPRAAGAITQPVRWQARKLQVAGSAMGFGGGVSAIQGAVDAIRAALMTASNGQPAALYFGRGDRFINAQVDSVTESYGGGETEGSWYGASHALTVSFVAGDPFFYDAGGVTTATLSSSGGTVTTQNASGVVCNAPCFASWSITIGTAGTGTVTLTNTTTGEAATLAGTFSSGDVISLQRGANSYTVLLNGTSSPGLMSGVIPQLVVGANVIAVSAATVSFSVASASYTARWLG